MQRYDIRTSALIRKKGVQTSATMLPIRPNGERPALHVPGASREFTLEDVDMDLIGGADFLHIGGTPLMPNFDGDPMSRVFRYGKKNDVVTTYDLLAVEDPELKEKIEICLPYVDYFMPGLEEAAMVSGLTNPQDIARYFLDMGCGHTVFKMGGEGSRISWYENGGLEELRIPAFKANVVDSTGCGDAYCAGFIAGLAQGWDLEKAGRLGAAAGALVIQGLGSDAGIVSLEETVKFMESAPILP
jgi:sugar/nucleoside kinase (ribokinase family)